MHDVLNVSWDHDEMSLSQARPCRRAADRLECEGHHKDPVDFRTIDDAGRVSTQDIRPMLIIALGPPLGRRGDRPDRHLDGRLEAGRGPGTPGFVPGQKATQ